MIPRHAAAVVVTALSFWSVTVLAAPLPDACSLLREQRQQLVKGTIGTEQSLADLQQLAMAEETRQGAFNPEFLTLLPRSSKIGSRHKHAVLSTSRRIRLLV